MHSSLVPLRLPTFFLLLLVAAGCGLPPDEVEPMPIPPSETGTGGRVFYAVTKVEGTYGGGATKVMGSRVDTIADVRCAFASPGTNPNQKPFLGDPAADTWSKGVTVSGEANCPAATGSSSAQTATCQAGAHVQATQFQWTVEVTGWRDDSEVVLRASAPNVLPFSCNFAAVLGEQGHPWGLVARTTVGQFRTGKPFEVRFVGSSTLSHDGNTSNVGWDLVLTVAPQ